MENEVKRCLACGTEIPKASKACYCNNKCYMAAYYRRHNPRKELSGECLCYYNIEVLCTDRQCENCGWNPIVEQRRRDMLARQFPELETPGKGGLPSPTQADAEAEKETVSKEAF